VEHHSHNSLLASSIRHDGRAFAVCRDMHLNNNVVHTALASASLTVGRTVVIAGVQAIPGALPPPLHDYTHPRYSDPRRHVSNSRFLRCATFVNVCHPCLDTASDVSIDLGPSCGERFRLGKPSDYACALSLFVHDALQRFVCAACLLWLTLCMGSTSLQLRGDGVHQQRGGVYSGVLQRF